MNPDAQIDLLSQLRDIHGAPPAAFWPPAPGWWVLAALLLALLGWFALALLRRWRAARRRQSLLDELAELRDRHDPQQDPQAWLSSVNRLLKVAAMRAFPDDEPGSLKGGDWVSFLGGEDGGHAFSALADGPYREHPEFDDAVLESAAHRWIRRHG